MKSLLLQIAPQVCTCDECTTATCQRPPVLLAATPRNPKRWLHGRELNRWWARHQEDGAQRQTLGDRLRRDHLERVKTTLNATPGLKAQRGDE